MADVIFTALLQKQLDHISQQMGWVMQRTARSPIFSDSHDFSCFIADARGQLISVADGIPIHTGGGSFAIQAVIRDFGPELADGDVYILSDPYEAGGNHLPDWTIIQPAFCDGTLLGFVCNRAHQSDIGGGAAGTYNADAREIYHEGIRLPVLRLIEAGRKREDLWRLLKLNSRCPDLIDGDVGAMVGSTTVGARRLLALVAEYGLPRVLNGFEAILDYAERRMRAAISALPEGEYSGSDMSDNDCFVQCEVPVKVRLAVRDGNIVVDLTGSSAQVAGFKNSSLANTYSAVYVALLSYFDESLPRNAGSFRPIHIIAPAGTVVNALPPAPMTSNTVYPATEIIYAIWKALALAWPEHACAGWGKASHCISSGNDAADNTYVMYHMHAYPGAGAVMGRDGFPSMGTVITLGGMQIPNVESYERKYPVLIHRQELRCDAAGAGEYRGGSGVDYSADVLAPAEYSFRGEGLHTPSGFGILGGRTGDKASLSIRLEGGTVYEPPQYGIRNLPPLHIAQQSAAGGGWGDPRKRKPEKVQRDVMDGVVSLDAALRIYAVALDAQSLAIDHNATRELREAK